MNEETLVADENYVSSSIEYTFQEIAAIELVCNSETDVRTRGEWEQKMISMILSNNLSDYLRLYAKF